MNTHLYFIAILLPVDIEEKIKAIKNTFAEKYNSKKALRLPGHITLQIPFGCEEEDFLLEKLAEFTEAQSPFQVTFSGFGAFPPRVIYLKVEEYKKLSQLHLELINFMHLHIHLPLQTKPPLVPHVTLANKDLDKENFKKAWEEYKDQKFEASFLAKSMFLFKHDGKKWSVFKEFDLSKT